MLKQPQDMKDAQWEGPGRLSRWQGWVLCNGRAGVGWRRQGTPKVEETWVGMAENRFFFLLPPFSWD